MKFNSKTMTIHNADSMPYLTYNSLSEIDFINHAFSTKLGGVSTGEFTSMNFAFNRGDNPDSVTENYKRFAKVRDLIIIRLRLRLKTIILMFVRLQQKILEQVFISREILKALTL